MNSTMTQTITTLTAGACLLLSVGAPAPVLTVRMSDRVKNAPGTLQNPILVRRDNPALDGIVVLGDSSVRGTVSSPYSTDGQWTNFSGRFRITEMRQQSAAYIEQYTPVLPRQAVNGAGVAFVGTRAGTMVHGNIYALSMQASDKAGEKFAADKVKYIKLADDVMLVPVVVISWKKPGSDPKFVNETYPARNMFDFNPIGLGQAAPYTRPDKSTMQPLPNLTINPLYPALYDRPEPYWFAKMAPNLKETPPDEIWSKCGIQFQVVAQFIFDLPADWQNRCNIQALNFGQPEWAIAKELADQPALRDYLINDLKPIYVSYGDNSLCSTGWIKNSFFGTTPGKGNHIEIGFTRPRTTTAHELGHALGLDHEVDPVSKKPVEGNLMRENGIKDEGTLTADQCKKARSAAASYSARFDHFNWVTGRTYSPTPPPPPTGASPLEDLDGFDPGLPAEAVCCTGPTDVYWAAPGTCPNSQVSQSQCETVCCSGTTDMSRYLCTKTGGSVGAGQACAPK